LVSCSFSWETREWELISAASLYLIGLYEAVCPSNWEWFFQVDLIPAIRYCFLRFVGGGERIVLENLWSGLLALTRANKWAVLGVLFTLQGTLAISSDVTQLTNERVLK